MGVDFGHFRGTRGGGKNQKLFEKKVKALLQIKIKEEAIYS